VVLLIGAGLLIRSFATLLEVSPGFVPAHAVVTGISLPADTYPQGAPRERFLGEFLSRAGSLPGVTAVGVAMPMPMVNDFNSGFQIEGREVPSGERPLVNFYGVSAGYFAAMGTPLVRGRLLTDADRAGAPRVVVVNQTMVDRYFAGVDPIGRRLMVGQGDSAWREIVGI